MNFYDAHVVPRIVNAACGMKANDKTRRRVCAGLQSDVIEIGFGSGLNVPFYPSVVSRVDAVEPADIGWKLASKRLAATPIPSAGLASMASRCPPVTTGTTPPSRRGRCAPSPTPSRRCSQCDESSNQEGPCTSWSTDWLPMNGSSAGGTAWSRFRSESPVDATSPGR